MVLDGARRHVAAFRSGGRTEATVRTLLARPARRDCGRCSILLPCLNLRFASSVVPGRLNASTDRGASFLDRTRRFDRLLSLGAVKAYRAASRLDASAVGCDRRRYPGGDWTWSILGASGAWASAVHEENVPVLPLPNFPQKRNETLTPACLVQNSALLSSRFDDDPEVCAATEPDPCQRDAQVGSTGALCHNVTTHKFCLRPSTPSSPPFFERIPCQGHRAYRANNHIQPFSETSAIGLVTTNQPSQRL
ncbi:hypothetical protein B0T16DRAFT_249063 [Cercophora newfieldiana]|uniref:Uncharacterized protein n=1 Tax=Cercophora newfieldiana TaxID=92897 RepID=A0AA39XTC8_9PEZI|nr:hypothetical protein B0T16DRAFT_249063 [Cercophora newfieldiana]